MKKILILILLAFSFFANAQKYTTPSGSSGNTRYGTALPLPLTSDKKNDTYIRNSTGASNGVLVSTFKYDGTLWYQINGTDEVVNVTGAILPITFPVTTITGTPVFLPNQPTTANVLYSITDGTNIVSARWNGTQYISSAVTTIISNAANSPTNTNAQIAITNKPVGGLIGTAAATVDAGLSFEITQTTAGQTITLPSPTLNPTVPKFAIIKNNVASTQAITLYGNEIAAGNTGLVYWNGTIWSGANSVQNVASNQGVISTILDGQAVTSTAFTDVTNSTFTLPSVGDYMVTYVLSSNNSAGAGIVQSRCVDNANVFVPNSFSAYMQVTGGTITSSPIQITFPIKVLTANSVYKLQINSSSGTVTVRNNTTINNTLSGQSYVYWNQTSGNVPVSGVVGAVQGEIRPFANTASFSDWILCQGQAISTLTAAQQAVAIAKGFPINLPDMRNRSIVGSGLTFPYLTTGGTNNIAQNNLPNTTLSVSANSPNYQFSSSAGGGAVPSFATQSANQVLGSISVTGTTSSINGGVAQQLFMTPYIAMNYFIWLGTAATTVTTPTALTVQTSNAPNSLTGGLLNISNTPYVGANGTSAGILGLVNSAAIGQQNSLHKGDGTWTPVNGLQAIGANVSIGTTGSTARLNIGLPTVLSTATPDDINMGATFSSVAGANPKLKLFSTGGIDTYGIGISNGQMDFILPASASYNWFLNGLSRMKMSPIGYLGLGTSTVATSTFQLNGSYANTPLVISTATTLGDVEYVQTQGAVTYTVTLPIASTMPGRRYVIKNTNIIKSITGYNNTAGTTSTTIPLGILVLVSSGGNWEQF